MTQDNKEFLIAFRDKFSQCSYQQKLSFCETTTLLQKEDMLFLINLLLENVPASETNLDTNPSLSNFMK